MRRSSVPFLTAALVAGALLVYVASLTWTASAAPGKGPQQAPTFAQPTDQGVSVTLYPNPNATPTYVVPDVIVDSGTGTPSKFGPPPTFDQILTAEPDAKAFLDSIKGLTVDKIDLAQLYNIIIKIYKDYKGQGGEALSVFLHDSGLLDLLNIPQGYLDLLTIYDQSGMDGLIKAATARKIINTHNELSGFMKLDTKDNLATVQAALQTLGVSTYAYNDVAGELEIGIPVDTLLQFQSPDTLLGYLLKIANTPHVIGFRVPLPEVKPAK